MAVPAYATDLTDIYTDTDNFSAVGGGRVTATETDDYIQGSNCWSHDPFSSGIEGGAYDTTTGLTITSGSAVFIWTKCDVAATLATHAAGGIQAIIGNSTTAYECWYVRGSDDYQYGGWQCIPVDPTKTASTTVGTPNGTLDHFGVRWNVPSTGASKGYPMKIDAIRWGSNIEITAGDGTTPATWDLTAAHDSTTTRQWGICQPTNSGAAIQGDIYWGTASASVYSRDSNRTIVIVDTEWTDTDFTQILFAHASNDVIWDNIGLLALGTNNRGIIDVTANGTVEWTNSVFQDIDITTLLSGCTFDGSKWLSCNEVEAGGASLVGCKILTPTVVADSHGLLWNTTGDPNGELDGMEFSKGTNAHHAIEFDATNTPTTITLTEIDFTGFNASNGNNDSALYFPSTSKSYTVNLVGCTGDITYKVGTGGSVTFVVDPVTLEFTVKDGLDGSLLSDARVLAWVTSGANFTYQGSCTLTGSGTTVTVAHTAHGYATNDYVYIDGATPDEYNGVHQITVTGVDAYTYTLAASVSTSPATGTITSTYVLISGLTSSGLISDSWSLSSDQTFGFRVRKSTSSPLFVGAEGSDTISTVADKDLTIQLARDE